MRKFLWFIVVVIVIIVIFLLASPVYYGKAAERVIKNRIASANKQYAKYGIKVSLQSYHRHWYSSNADLLIKINNKNLKSLYKQSINPNFNLNNPIVFHEILAISHGPVIYDRHASSRFAASYVRGYLEGSKILNQKLQLTQPIIQFHGRLSYSGYFAGFITMPTLHFENAQTQMKYGSISIYAVTAPDLSMFKGWGVSQPTVIVDKNTGLTHYTSGGRTTFDFTKKKNGLWVGSSSNTLGKLQLSFTKNIHFNVTLDNAKSSMTFLDNQQGYSMKYHLTADKISYTKGKSIHQFDVSFAINNIHSSAFSKIQSEIVNAMMTSKKEQINQLNHILETSGSELLTNKTNFVLQNLSMQLPNGLVKISGRLAFPAYQQEMSAVAILMSANASVSVTAGKQVVDQYIRLADQKLNAYQAQEQRRAALREAKIRAEHARRLKKAREEEQAKHQDKTSGDTMHALPVMEPGPVMPAPQPPQNMVSKQFKQYLTKGFITESNDQYHTTVDYNAGQLTANGHAVGQGK